jgi:GNAT superfamily N-acetyltransferase
MAVQITTVHGPRALKAFVDLPFRLHADTVWIPPLKEERLLFLSRRLNAFFTHGEAEYFLARRGGRVVGRITAHIDHAYNEFHGTNAGMFGFIEFEDDPEIVAALLAAAETWLRARGVTQMLGPMDFALNDEGGILIEGHALEPLVRHPWHPPYYQARLEAAGLSKAMDLLSWSLDVSDRERLDPRLPRIAERARTRHGVTIRRMTRRHLRRDLDEFARVYNAAWSHNWGFVPYAKADLDAYWVDLQLIFSKDWFMVAEIDGETVGMAITIPDVAQIYKRMRGHLLPVGWIWYVLRWRIMDRLRVGFLGVIPEYEHTGVAAALYLEHFDVAQRVAQKHGEAGFILETNSSMNRALEAMGGRVVKRWRVYERTLADPPE